MPDATTTRLRAPWDSAWSALGVRPRAGLFEALLARYREPQRHYHTLEHLQECLAHLAGAPVALEHPGEVALALWFHDAVYALERQDNELQSARWLQQEVAAAGARPLVGQRLFDLVMGTRHDARPEGADARLLVDIDLSILGAPPARFAAYERQIRQEYRHVPDAVFRAHRRALLQTFLARPELYATAFFRDRLEARARRNLEASVAALSSEATEAAPRPDAGP